MSLENTLVLGRYRVLWPLEHKKLIKTYIARDEHRDGFGTPVLVKQYLHDLGDRESPGVGALLEELTALTHLRHSGVVSLLDYGLVSHCLVTAYVHLPGVDLSQLCDHFGRQQKAFPAHLAVYMVRRLLKTLHYCHTYGSRSFVHGRITLGCIHLPSVGEPQIADFGLASLEDVAAEAESQLGFFQTRMSYAAPELTRGGPPTPQGDAYSLALLLYRLLSGSNPFRGRSIPETLQRVLQLSPAELLMPDWDRCAEANAILMRALSKDANARHQTCLELSDALARIQSRTDESLGEELSSLVRSNSTADWAQISKLTRSVRKSLPPRPKPELAGVPAESKAPAFVSGLITDQPISVTEHTESAAREALVARQRRRQLAVLPTVLIPAAAIIFGLFLGRLGGAGVNAPAPLTAAVIPEESVQLVNGSVDDLRARLRSCVAGVELKGIDAKVELDFGARGDLSGVRLNPHQLAHTRFGACLLETAWKAKVSAPGAMSLVIPLAGRD